jgi:hypothetical protein
MSSDPERPIEKLLRASAKQRRDQADGSWDLHPINRRLLQREVAKKFGASRESKPGRSLGWLGGLSWAKSFGAMTVIAMVVIVAWWSTPRSAPDGAPTYLARNEMEKSASRALNERSSEKRADVEFKHLVDSQTTNFLVADERARKKAELDAMGPSNFQKDNVALTPPALAQTTPQASLQSAPAPSERMAAATEPLAANTPQAGAPATVVVAQNASLAAGSANAQPPQTLGLAKESVARFDQAKSSLSESASAPPLSESAAAPSAFVVSKVVAGAVDHTSAPAIPYGLFASTSQLARQRRELGQATQAFSPRNAAALNEELKPGPFPVLSVFRVEQIGSELHVFDSDGSLYSGPIRVAAAPSRDQVSPEATATDSGELLRSRASPAQAVKSFQPQSPTSSAADAYTFEVVGTNQTTKQKVVFSGKLIGGTNPSVRPGVVTQGGLGAGAAQYSDATAAPAVYQVSGSARIGTSLPVKIDAKRVPDKTPASSGGK